MREKKYHVYLTPEDYKRLVEALVFKKNQLLETGHYTDAVDEMLVKVSRPRIRNVKVG